MAMHGGRMINWCLCTLQWFSLGYVRVKSKRDQPLPRATPGHLT